MNQKKPTRFAHPATSVIEHMILCYETVVSFVKEREQVDCINQEIRIERESGIVEVHQRKAWITSRNNCPITRVAIEVKTTGGVEQVHGPIEKRFEK